MESITIGYRWKPVEIQIKDIIRIEGNSNYCLIITKKSKHLAAKTLMKFEAELPNNFLRIHRRHLINTDCVICDNGNRFLMIDGSDLELSRRKKSVLLREGRLD